MRDSRTFDAPKQAQRDWPDAQSGNRAQQPAQVEARRAQHRMQRIAGGTLEPAAPQSVILFDVADDRFDCLTALEPLALLLAQRLVLAAVNQFHRAELGVDS